MKLSSRHRSGAERTHDGLTGSVWVDAWFGGIPSHSQQNWGQASKEESGLYGFSHCITGSACSPSSFYPQPLMRLVCSFCSRSTKGDNKGVIYKPAAKMETEGQA